MPPPRAARAVSPSRCAAAGAAAGRAARATRASACGGRVRASWRSAKALAAVPPLAVASEATGLRVAATAARPVAAAEVVA
eukprot:466551-Prymnesium_polylepis.1